MAFLKRFYRSTTGNVAAMIAVALALVVVPLTAFGINYYQRSTLAQKVRDAADAAALSAAITYQKNAANASQRLDLAVAAGNQTMSALTNGFKADIPNLSWTITLDSSSKDLIVLAKGDVPSLFGMFGSLPVVEKASAGAGAGKPIEVALVLDNTASMFDYNRFDKLREAAKSFVNTVFDANQDKVRVAVVPWTITVNILSEPVLSNNATAVGNQTFSMAGSRRLPVAPSSSRLGAIAKPGSPSTPATAQDLATAFAPAGWRGCIESYNGEVAVDSGGNVTKAISDAAPTGLWPAALVPTPLPSATWNGQNCDLTNAYNQGSFWGYLAKAYNCTSGGWQNGFKGPCISDPNELNYMAKGGSACPFLLDVFPNANSGNKYSGKGAVWLSYNDDIMGPNVQCPVPILPLSGNRGQVIDKLNEMYPVPGGTMADVGLFWGLRVLSPASYWTSFWGLQQAAGPWKDPSVWKIMILLTDGYNEFPTWYEGYYGCTRTDNRAGAGQCWRSSNLGKLGSSVSNTMTTSACNIIKNTYGVELFTVAVDVTDSNALSLLNGCATDSQHFYKTSTSSLGSTFDALAARTLRLTH